MTYATRKEQRTKRDGRHAEERKREKDRERGMMGRGRKRMAFALASSQIPPHQNVGKTSRGESGQRAPDVIPRATSVPTRFGLGDGREGRPPFLPPANALIFFRVTWCAANARQAIAGSHRSRCGPCALHPDHHNSGSAVLSPIPIKPSRGRFAVGWGSEGGRALIGGKSRGYKSGYQEAS